MRNEKIKKALDLLRKKEWEACDYASNANEAADILEQLLADQPAQDDVEQSSTQSKETFDQPVAWKDEQGNVRMTIDSGEIQSSVGYVYSVHGERIKNACIRSDITNGTPLYTRPQAREPLTMDELHSIREHQELLKQLGPVWAPMLYYFCAAIEAAHGIKGEA